MSYWIQTYTGVAFDLLDPRPECIEIEDIAHALANQCRYNGHTRGFYSVAQHSCLVSVEIEAEGLARTTHDPVALRSDSLWGLLHDAAEAYCGDLVSPMKRVLRAVATHDAMRLVDGGPGISTFDEIERDIQKVIVQKYGLEPDEPPIVKEYDLRLLATERRDLFGPCPRDWGLKFEPLERKIIPAVPRVAETEFSRRFERLAGARP